MTTHNTIRAACPTCSAHGEVWDEELGRMKPCLSCLGNCWVMEDRIHIPSPPANPDEAPDGPESQSL